MKTTSLYYIIPGATLLLIAWVFIGTIIMGRFLEKRDEQPNVACTMEAKLCPDGSAVSRTGPNCEFDACPKEAAFGSTINFTIGKDITFNDGLELVLKGVDDSRCKQGVACVWAGELAPVFMVKGGALGDVFKEIRLGTATAKQVVKDGYLFVLSGATEDAATVTISRERKGLNFCYVGGCSSEICSDQEGVVSTCIYKEEYACYKAAACARQGDGKCGWTQTGELKACLHIQ